MFTKTCLFAVAFACTACLTNALWAIPTKVTHAETPECDVLFIPQDVHEIGDAAIFPTNEGLLHSTLGTANPVCLPRDNSAMPDFLVSIINTSGIDFAEVWYVADQETTISNYDGEGNDISFAPLRETFRIDSLVSDPLGMHHPLIFESGLADGIWQNGEEWRFVLQDYTNSLGIAPDMFVSVGVGDASFDPPGAFASSGSIIALPVPEPATLLLAVMGLLGAVAIHRRKWRS